MKQSLDEIGLTKGIRMRMRERRRELFKVNKEQLIHTRVLKQRPAVQVLQGSGLQFGQGTQAAVPRESQWGTESFSECLSGNIKFMLLLL